MASDSMKNVKGMSSDDVAKGIMQALGSSSKQETIITKMEIDGAKMKVNIFLI